MKRSVIWVLLIVALLISAAANANEYLRMELVVYTEEGVQFYDVSEDQCYEIVGELGEQYDTVAMCVAPQRTVI